MQAYINMLLRRRNLLQEGMVSVIYGQERNAASVIYSVRRGY